MKKIQGGFFLIEAMVAVLIFALGILGMVAMGSTSVSAQSDARYRTAAANLADEIAAKIALNVDRTSSATVQASVINFQHLAGPPGPDGCTFTGAPSGQAVVQNWALKTYTVGPGQPGLPGSDATHQQILVDNTTSGFNRVAITVCWKAPADAAMRRHTLVTYIN